MGQRLSCRGGEEQGLFAAAQLGDVDAVEAALQRDSSLISRATVYDRNSLLHIAAANGRIEVVSLLVDRSVDVDVLNRHKQTPLMMAAMHGKISCVEKLIESGANILMFDSLNGRTCLHYVAYYGHSNCLQFILTIARASPVSSSWGFSRFVNVRDRKGATPLHLAARQGRPQCVHSLLDNGAIVCASTGGYGFSGSTPLHLAARSGSIDCVRELLAWGADRSHRDASGRIPYTVALRHHHGACAALLNPASAEPLVWPSPLKFISELNPEAKALLERALMEANKDREKAILKGTVYSLPSPSNSELGIDDDISEESDGDVDLCSICFDQICTIEVRDCGHRMCAQCTLALCCHNKPNPANSFPPSSSIPICPFCRSNIVKLVVAQVRPDSDSKPRKSWRSRHPSEGSSSFKGLSTSFGKLGRGSGRIVTDDEILDKPISLDT
ncbi:putative E3 ubiquitin-protein ligase XBAT31 [Andrographis paniculata]|uniref:putative E3 ubiquitin-protein ligase XBAT31 n=1 Tax=Andrographis paniculata TaxID=175694 RepID=UPI0021E78686|nr:putative E3 ubiquitin-protein ligase XBAT31 [Andrographis paniculata]